MNKTLFCVVPCFNEQEVLPHASALLDQKLRELIDSCIISPESRVLFVDDGSSDKTWEIIEALHKKNGLFCGLKLSRNRGHQNAVLAGLMAARERADMVITMDADLQDDLSVIDSFVLQHYKGSDIVYGVRSSRYSDTTFKRLSAELFYKLMSAMGVDIVYNHADYRLMSRRALDALAEYDEVNLFLRGIVPLIGFNQSIVTYRRGERYSGQSKYPLHKMLNFAWEGITSFSVKPLRLIASLGLFVTLFSFFAVVYALFLRFVEHSIDGINVLALSLWFLGGIQLLCMGIVGEYVGKVYSEVKRRPRYFIDKLLM